MLEHMGLLVGDRPLSPLAGEKAALNNRTTMLQNTEMTKFRLQGQAASGFARARDYVNAWCAQHQWQTGVAQMALGAGIIAVGLKTGALQMGADVVIIAFGKETTTTLLAAGAGAALGTLPGFLLSNIGVAALGTAIGVPALALMGGGALILGLAGYGVSGLIQDFLHPVPNFIDLASSSALVLVGVALIVDGARRIKNDPDVRSRMAAFRNNVLALHRVATARVIDSMSSLCAYFESEVLPFLGEATNPKAATATAALAALGGAAGGNAFAVSSVTLLGSSSLGALGLSLGIVSAPIWPIVAGGGLALAAVYGLWQCGKRSGPTLVFFGGDGLSPP